jgi:chromosome segregation ATPase
MRSEGEYDPTMNVGHIITGLMDKISQLKEQRDNLDARVASLATENADIRIESNDTLKSLRAQVDQLTYRNGVLHNEIRNEREQIGKLEEHLRASEKTAKYWEQEAVARARAVTDLIKANQELKGNPLIQVDTTAQARVEELEEELRSVQSDRDYWKTLALEHGAALAELRAKGQAPVSHPDVLLQQARIDDLLKDNEDLRHNMRNIRDNVMRWTNKFV